MGRVFCSLVLADLGRIKKDPALHPRGPWALGRMQRKIWGLTHGKAHLLRKEQKEHLQEEVGQAKRGAGTRGDEVLGLSRQDLYIFISAGGDWQFWLTVASCITADSIAPAFSIIQSVKFRCMCV